MDIGIGSSREITAPFSYGIGFMMTDQQSRTTKLPIKTAAKFTGLIGTKLITSWLINDYGR